MEIIKKLQNWALSWDFVKKEMYTRVYRDATKDVLETNTEDIEKRAKELSEKLLNDLLSPVDLTQIATVGERDRQLYIGGERADASKVQNLQAEANILLSSDLWKILYETPKELAQREMFVMGDNLDSMKKGRSILYTLATQKKVIDTIKSYIPKVS